MSELDIFENFKIRHHYDEEKEKYYFSVIDIISVLTEQRDYKKAKSYWTTLKSRLNKEESQVVAICDHLTLPASDGKKYLTGISDVQSLDRAREN